MAKCSDVIINLSSYRKLKIKQRKSVKLHQIFITKSLKQVEMKEQ